MATGFPSSIIDEGKGVELVVMVIRVLGSWFLG